MKHHRRSGKNSNANKLKSKYRKTNKRHRHSIKIDHNQSAIGTSTLRKNETSFNAHAMIRDHLYISIVGLLCFFPTGIFALLRAIQANKMKKPSSILYWPKLAAIYGRHALRWAVLSILIGTMLWTIFIIYWLLRRQSSLWGAYHQDCSDQLLCLFN